MSLSLSLSTEIHQVVKGDREAQSRAVCYNTLKLDRFRTRELSASAMLISNYVEEIKSPPVEGGGDGYMEEESRL